MRATGHDRRPDGHSDTTPPARYATASPHVARHGVSAGVRASIVNAA